MGSTIHIPADVWAIDLDYSFGNNTIGLVYEDLDQEGAGNTNSRDAWHINFTHKFGANTWKLAYGDADDSDAPAVNDGVDNWVIAMDHAFSGRTRVYALYSEIDSETGTTYGLNPADWVSSDGTGAAAVIEGLDVEPFSLGITHKF
ncbi:MAG: porin [Gammaproteobacteria bacterium]|nr:porin [Gammaproteobacteria bacterium]